ncbi:hypothetical protein V3481_001564 [Fusarium oxysporum f. sp. vasinfectum]
MACRGVNSLVKHRLVVYWPINLVRMPSISHRGNSILSFLFPQRPINSACDLFVWARTQSRAPKGVTMELTNPVGDSTSTQLRWFPHLGKMGLLKEPLQPMTPGDTS